MKQEKLYWSKEVYRQLNIGASTLRKWCLLLEEKSYSFTRDEQDRRVYREEDMDVLRELQALMKNNNMTLEAAVSQVLSTRPTLQLQPPSPPQAEVVPPHGSEPISDPEKVRIDQLLEYVETLVRHIERQEAFNIELLDRLKKQEAYIEVALMRDEKMRIAMKEIAATNQRRQKKKWYKLWM
ncbi:MAG: MerR family transcriptional regulator [Tumebacillaceae bacterium]